MPNGRLDEDKKDSRGVLNCSTIIKASKDL